MLKTLRLITSLSLIFVLSACLGPSKLDGSSGDAFQSSLGELVSELDAAEKAKVINSLETIAIHYNDYVSMGLSKPSPKFLAMIHGASLKDIERIAQQVRQEKNLAQLEQDIEVFILQSRNKLTSLKNAQSSAQRKLTVLESEMEHLDEINNLIQISSVRFGQTPDRFDGLVYKGQWLEFDIVFKSDSEGTVSLMNFVIIGEHEGITSEACYLGLSSESLPLRIGSERQKINFGCLTKSSNLDQGKFTIIPSAIKLEGKLCSGQAMACLLSYPRESGAFRLSGAKPKTPARLLEDLRAAEKELEEQESSVVSFCKNISETMRIRELNFKLSSEQLNAVGC